MTIKITRSQNRPSTDVEFWYSKDHGYEDCEASSLKEYIEETTEISADGLTLTKVNLFDDSFNSYNNTILDPNPKRQQMFIARSAYFKKNNIIYSYFEEKI